METEACWININRNPLLPPRISDDFLEGLHDTTNVHRLRSTPYLTLGDRDNATHIHYYPVRFTDIALFNHTNNSVYWSVVEDCQAATPELLHRPIRVTIEREAPIALGDTLEIIAHVHPAGSTDDFGPGLVNRTVTTLTMPLARRPRPSLFDLRAIATASTARRSTRARTRHGCRRQRLRIGHVFHRPSHRPCAADEAPMRPDHRLHIQPVPLSVAVC
jgi:hypothetical protein